MPAAIEMDRVKTDGNHALKDAVLDVGKLDVRCLETVSMKIYDRPVASVRQADIFLLKTFEKFC